MDRLRPYAEDEGVDMRPSLTISRNASVELPVTLSLRRVRASNPETGTVEERVDHVKLHAHGGIVCYKFPNSVVQGEDEDEGAKLDKQMREAAKKAEKDAKKVAPVKGEEKAAGKTFWKMDKAKADESATKGAEKKSTIWAK